MDENAGPGRVLHTGRATLHWGSLSMEIGDVEFLLEEGRIVKVLSFTPIEFDYSKESEAPAEDGFLEEQRTGEDG